jgi:hypothetical protein
MAEKFYKAIDSRKLNLLNFVQKKICVTSILTILAEFVLTP